MFSVQGDDLKMLPLDVELLSLSIVPWKYFRLCVFVYFDITANEGNLSDLQG